MENSAPVKSKQIRIWYYILEIHTYPYFKKWMTVNIKGIGKSEIDIKWKIVKINSINKLINSMEYDRMEIEGKRERKERYKIILLKA